MLTSTDRSERFIAFAIAVIAGCLMAALALFVPARAATAPMPAPVAVAPAEPEPPVALCRRVADALKKQLSP